MMAATIHNVKVGTRVYVTGTKGMLNPASTVERRGLDFVVIGKPFTEPGAHVVDDGVGKKLPDWTCVPIVEEMLTDEVSGNPMNIDEFVRFYGEKADIYFADINDLGIVP